MSRALIKQANLVNENQQQIANLLIEEGRITQGNRDATRQAHPRSTFII
ncbi:hypothetical protein P8S54_01975 [Thiomicrospira sp. R3]|nr:hypothetical protein [Thiomicrospira sp. R3]WFE69088.1 hypothetical protein P8S54_01975 [Thiomicrospira sp. R3]